MFLSLTGNKCQIQFEVELDSHAINVTDHLTPAHTKAEVIIKMLEIIKCTR